MDEKELQLTDYLHVIRRRKWILITFFVVTVGLVSLGTLRQTPIYRATTSILIEKEPPQTIKTQEVVTLGEEGDYVKYYNTQLKILQSRDIAERALARMGGPEVIFPAPEKESSRRFQPAPSTVTDSQTIDSRGWPRTIASRRDTWTHGDSERHFGRNHKG